MLQTAAGMSMAGPMFVVGIDFLRTGEPVYGVAFLVFGAIALYLPTYLVNRLGGRFRGLFSLRRRAGGSEPDATADDGATAADEGDDATAADGDSPLARLERFRRR